MQSSLINGRYQIIRTLGQGGFGDTFLVKDMQLPSQRQCVLKALKINATNPALIQEIQRRFQREAAILEGLGENNPQIPKLFAYFEDQGKFYLVQEWIDGLTLQDMVQQQGCLSLGQVQNLILDLLPVLQSIHDKYIIHRDIKPENIILRSIDQKPVLIDFGAVKEALTTAILPDQSNPVSVAIGTPGYMAPEQATGRPVYSSDLYGLGFTAIYLLTGKSPQYFPTDPHTGELLWQREFPYLQTSLGQAIATSVKFHPRDRFPTANAMLHTLLNQAPPAPQPIATAPLAPHPATAATRVIGSPASPTTAPTSAASRPQTTAPAEGMGCWQLTLILLMFGVVGIGSGLWISFAIIGRSPSPEPTPIEPIPTQPIPEPEPIPEPIPEPEPEPEPIPEPIPEPEPEPEPEPAPVDVPIMPVGTAEAAIKASLGEPAEESAGLWGDSRALLYPKYGSTGLSLGYIVDNASGVLQQTEVTFPVGTDVVIIQQTLEDLTPEAIPPEVIDAVQQVYVGNQEIRTFTLDNHMGQIKRQPSGRLYLGLWNPEFHP